MKSPVAIIVLLLTVIIESWVLFGGFIVKDKRFIPSPRCEERILPKADVVQVCPSPSRLMRIDEQWICTCRSEVDTMKGIQHQ
jgi:hypothetical protein